MRHFIAGLLRRSRRFRLALPLLLLPATLHAQDVPPSAPMVRFEPFTLETRGHGAIAAELGTFDVPVRHDQPAGATRALRFVRLRAESGAPSIAPVIYLAGGPGGSGIAAARGARWPIFNAVRQHADVILLDQRGTGLSDPPPACPQSGSNQLPLDSLVSRAMLLASLQAEAVRCVAAWRAMGVDLDEYSTTQSAADIDLLRRALGAERVSLWGMSYGTHLALAALRHTPARVARIVLMGTEGPDHTLKRPLTADTLLASVHAWAAADPVARTLTPDLVGSLRRQLARLDSAPMVASLPGAGGSTQRMKLGRFDLQLVVVAALARTQTASLLPVVLGFLDKGDPTWLARFAVQIRQAPVSLAAMPLAMDVASGATRERRLLVESEVRSSMLGDALNFPWPEIGNDLGITDLGDSFRSPVRSRVPALFISGTMDGRTPPLNAAEVMAGFRHAGHLILDGAGHDDDLWTASPIIADRIAAFFAGGRPVSETISTPLLQIPEAGP